MNPAIESINHNLWPSVECEPKKLSCIHNSWLDDRAESDWLTISCTLIGLYWLLSTLILLNAFWLEIHFKPGNMQDRIDGFSIKDIWRHLAWWSCSDVLVIMILMEVEAFLCLNESINLTRVRISEAGFVATSRKRFTYKKYNIGIGKT